MHDGAGPCGGLGGHGDGGEGGVGGSGSGPGGPVGEVPEQTARKRRSTGLKQFIFIISQCAVKGNALYMLRESKYLVFGYFHVRHHNTRHHSSCSFMVRGCF